MTLTVKFFKNYGLSPGATMVQKMQLELLAKGFAQPEMIQSGWDEPALIAYEDETPVGVMVYRPLSYRAVWAIMHAYVEPEHRRKGIHTLLFETLVRRAKLSGDVNVIESGAHVNNTASIRSMQKQGRVATIVHYDYRLRDFEVPTPPLQLDKKDG